MCTTQGIQVSGCCEQSLWLKQPRWCGDLDAWSRILLSDHKKTNLESGGGFTGVQRSHSDFHILRSMVVIVIRQKPQAMK